MDRVIIMNLPLPSTAMRQRGTTLIEVLVAVLILSIGLLGIAGLQASAMRYAQGGWARAAVSSNLSDLADRIRANPDAADTAYQLSTSYAAQRAAIDTLAVATNCMTATCTADQLADFQLKQWQLAIARDMPGAAGFVSGTRSTGYVVTAIWFDKTNVSYGSDGKPTTAEAVTACSKIASGVPFAERTCCPDAASAPAGARCTNMMVMP